MWPIIAVSCHAAIGPLFSPLLGAVFPLLSGAALPAKSH
jgi:hypothetical protein